MSTLKLSLLLSVLIFVTACSQLRAFEDRRREPGTEYIYIGSSKPTRPVICYNPLWEDNEDLKTMADEICRKNDAKTHAEFINKEYFSCRLFVPAKAYYKCVK